MYTEIYSQLARGSQFPFSVCCDPSEVMPWCIQFAGGGHYFATMPEAVQYARSRKWITTAKAVKVIDEINSKLNML